MASRSNQPANSNTGMRPLLLMMMMMIMMMMLVIIFIAPKTKKCPRISGTAEMACIFGFHGLTRVRDDAAF